MEKLTPKNLLNNHVGGLYEYTARLVIYLYALELGIMITVFGLYKTSTRPWSIPTTVWTRAGFAIAIGLALLFVSGFLIIRDSVRYVGNRRRMWVLATCTNLIAVSFTVVALEGIFHITAREDPSALSVLRVGIPYNERELFDRSRRTIGKEEEHRKWTSTFFVYDAELGWTVGKSRTTPDGMYSSSEEGLRSEVAGIRLRDATPLARVAMLGDSNTFSLEVPYQESWAYHLQQRVGVKTQVLNFGVDGYGIDQMYLKYLRDVRSWHPDVVLVGFIEDDLRRSMFVYPFLKAWSEYVVKPRFDDRIPTPKVLNVPLPTPEEVLSVKSARALSYLDYDPWALRSRWLSWIDDGPLILRFVNALTLPWNVLRPQFSEETIATLNARLFAWMRDAIVQDGARPIFIFLPNPDTTGTLTHRTFQLAQVPLSDMSACVGELQARQQFVASGWHFTNLANATIAKCISEEILVTLSKRSRHQE